MEDERERKRREQTGDRKIHYGKRTIEQTTQHMMQYPQKTTQFYRVDLEKK
jgi:hypothetical protein